MTFRSALDTSRLRTKLGLSAVILLIAAALVGGTYATWMSTVSQAQTITSGTVQIALGATGAATNRLNIATGMLAPGDTVSRTVDLTNTGTLPLGSITLTTTATTSSKLDTDLVNGLQLQIDACSAPWTESGTSPGFSDTCGGTATVALAFQPLLGSNLDLGSLNALAPGGTDHLRVSLHFPATADNTFQSQTSVVSYAFTGTQQP
jgi:spore coat-associated protein N